MAFVLPNLPYEYNGLEPAISEEVMRLHHTKHHQIYVDKLNEAIGKYPDYSNWTVVDLLSKLEELPEDIRVAVHNNGGGHYNHSLFWQCMTPGGRLAQGSNIYNAIIQRYGSFDSFVDTFTTSALSLFGSGWVWLTADVEIITSQNQDNPLMSEGHEPLMGLDVWEHAYYLDYRNKRSDYIRAWWSVVDWEFIANRYDAVLGSE